MKAAHASVLATLAALGALAACGTPPRDRDPKGSSGNAGSDVGAGGNTTGATTGNTGGSGATTSNGGNTPGGGTTGTGGATTTTGGTGVGYSLTCTTPATGSPVLRLFTRLEFENTINDLFPGIKGQWTNSLPAAAVSSVTGFDNDISNKPGNQFVSSLSETAESIAVSLLSIDRSPSEGSEVLRFTLLGCGPACNERVESPGASAGPSRGGENGARSAF